MFERTSRQEDKTFHEVQYTRKGTPEIYVRVFLNAQDRDNAVLVQIGGLVDPRREHFFGRTSEMKDPRLLPLVNAFLVDLQTEVDLKNKPVVKAGFYFGKKPNIHVEITPSSEANDHKGIYFKLPWDGDQANYKKESLALFNRVEKAVTKLEPRFDNAIAEMLAMPLPSLEEEEKILKGGMHHAIDLQKDLRPTAGKNSDLDWKTRRGKPSDDRLAALQINAIPLRVAGIVADDSTVITREILEDIANRVVAALREGNLMVDNNAPVDVIRDAVTKMEAYYVRTPPETLTEDNAFSIAQNIAKNLKKNGLLKTPEKDDPTPPPATRG